MKKLFKWGIWKLLFSLYKINSGIKIFLSLIYPISSLSFIMSESNNNNILLFPIKYNLQFFNDISDVSYSASINALWIFLFIIWLFTKYENSFFIPTFFDIILSVSYLLNFSSNLL